MDSPDILNLYQTHERSMVDVVDTWLVRNDFVFTLMVIPRARVLSSYGILGASFLVAGLPRHAGGGVN
jgi:hypothetical protein